MFIYFLNLLWYVDTNSIDATLLIFSSLTFVLFLYNNDQII